MQVTAILMPSGYLQLPLKADRLQLGQQSKELCKILRGLSELAVPCRSRNNELQNRVNGEREARNVRICAAVEQNPSLSSRQIADQLDDCSKDTVGRVLKTYGYKTFRISVENQLLPHDAVLRQVCLNLAKYGNGMSV